MVVLALDTTSLGGSCALVRDGHVLAERPGAAERSQGARVPGDLADLLAAAGLAIGEVDAFAVVAGPGSFTGLRVGIAAMQGLASASRRPLLGVSGLDALAAIGRRLYPEHDRVTWVDAWRGEVYSARYGRDGSIEEPAAATPSAILARLPPGPAVFLGTGAATYAALIAETNPEAVLPAPAAPALAGMAALLAWRRAEAGERPGPDAIRPLYVRRPDVELLRDARP